jgi:sn-glycerol 3-phosphate transport system substrate-binding protein
MKRENSDSSVRDINGCRRMVTILMLLLSLLAACSDGGGIESQATAAPLSESSAESAPEGVIELDFWYALGGSSGEIVEDLVEQFNATHPAIRINPAYQGGYAPIMAKMWNAIYAEETLPPVAHVGAAPLLGATGAIVPITDFADGPHGIDRSPIRDALWDYNSAEGKIWTMPFNNSVPVLYYNRDLFVAAGLDPEKPPTTWDEVIAYGQVLTSDTDGNGEIDQWGFNTHSDTHWYISTMFLENGAQIVDEEETEVLYNSPEGVEMLELWGDMVNRYEIMPPAQHKEAKGDFLAGKLAMFLQSSANIPSTLEEAGFDVGVAMIPTVAGREPVAPLGGASLVITKNDDQAILDAAWEFVRFMISPESSLYLATHTGYVPIYKDALEWPEMQSYLQENPLRRVPIEELEYACAIPIFSALGTSDGALRRAVESVELRAATAQEALDEAKTVVDRNILEQQ